MLIYDVPEKNKKEKEKMIEEYEKTKNEKQILQVDVDYLANGEKSAYLAGYIDGMKYILENEKWEIKRSTGFPYITTT